MMGVWVDVCVCVGGGVKNTQTNIHYTLKNGDVHTHGSTNLVVNPP